MHLRSPRIHPSFRWPRRDVEGEYGAVLERVRAVGACERARFSKRNGIYSGSSHTNPGRVKCFFLLETRDSAIALYAIFHTFIKKKIIHANMVVCHSVCLPDRC